MNSEKRLDLIFSFVAVFCRPRGEGDITRFTSVPQHLSLELERSIFCVGRYHNNLA